MWAGVIAAVAASGVLGALATGWLTRHKTGAEATKIIEAAAAGVVDTISKENARLLSRIEALEAEVRSLKSQQTESDHERERLRARVEALHAHIDTLEALMTASGVTPPPRPRLHES